MEAAFEGLLAGGLIRARHRIEDADCATWLPFLIALIAAIGFSFAAQSYKPQARTVFDMFAATQADHAGLASDPFKLGASRA